MRIAVTGASGFIGGHVLGGLLSAGHDAYGVDKLVNRSGLPCVEADINDLDAMTEALSGADAVMHLAAMANVNDVFMAPVEAARTNFLGTVTVLEAARQQKLKRFVLASTIWVYGGAGEYVDENTALPSAGPGHLYSTTKLAAEMAAQDYARLYNLPFTILRYGIPYGPQMRKELLIAKFLTDALDGKPLRLQGTGEQTRPFIYIDDLVRAHIAALGPEAANQVLNLPGPRLVTIREVAETVADLVGPIPINYTEARPGDLSGQLVSGEKAGGVLNWWPRVELREGTTRTLQWLNTERMGAGARA